MDRDHPRVRGEHWPFRFVAKSYRGPSPRARGARVRGGGLRGGGGTIPACAGSTHSPVSPESDRRDHPRVRGEHPAARARPFHPRGPSPRARGARCRTGAEDLRSGTIPACAGSTYRFLPVRFGARDHPRVRGEHPSSSAAARKRRGPSPRARGARVRGGGLRGGGGTIPACAGSTHSPVSPESDRRDHPRVRGEHGSCALRCG
ncbi:hypothetical protein EV190_10415 [Actinorugispora endophytica]|uniref:Uncharacterized protein n=1 Tax=Actinorugispora endophytica TaxID=1605990 RepID=A0A4R6V9N4_9ACTN|nr:hypothetical protein EV190_10415 [Actinorugispora endophytica]